MSGPVAARRAALDRLADERWDVLVVGGGIVGAGVLLDAVSRGLRAALVEQDDVAAGTSSRSSRLIHGGLRYLEDLRFHLVREALVERSRLLRLAPHLVRLEPFLFPVFGWPGLHRAFYGSGLLVYDLLGAARDGGRSRHLGAGKVAELAPPIRRSGLRGGITYHDGVDDDARLCLAVLRTALARGATAVTRVRADRLVSDGHGRLTGVEIHDLVGGERDVIRAGAVVDATGVWSGSSGRALGDPAMTIVPSRGSHVLVRRERLPITCGMALRVPGRVLFIVPWPGAWIIGTTDEPDAGPPARPAPTAHEVRDIIDTVNAVLDVDLDLNDCLGAYTGLRPLVGIPGGDTVRISREHTVQREQSGLVRVSGGKYTTYRLMARDAVDVALDERRPAPASATADVSLIGADQPDALERLEARLATGEGLSPEAATALVARHGIEATAVLAMGAERDLVRSLGPGIPHLEAEVAWAVREELAVTVDDVLSRRMRLSMMLPDRGASLAARVAEIMAPDLGWDDARRIEEVRAFLETAHREYDVPGATEPRAA